MKVRFVSDLHLEFAPYTLPSHEEDDQSVLVIAGDLTLPNKPSIMTDRALPFFQDVCARFRRVLVVLGNHEFYGGSIVRTADKYRDFLKDNDLDVVVLDRSAWTEDDVMFIGATLWTDCNRGDPLSGFLWGQMSDSKQIRVGPSKTTAYQYKYSASHTMSEHIKDSTYIWEMVKRAKDMGLKTVVVTHHAPTMASIAPRFVGNNFNMFYASDMSEKIFDNEPDVMLHGHIHAASDYFIGDTHVMCNPKGYPGEGAEGYDPQKSFLI